MISSLDIDKSLVAAGDALDEIVDKALNPSSAQGENGQADQQGLFGGLSRQLGSVAGFMRSLTK